MNIIQKNAGKRIHQNEFIVVTVKLFLKNYDNYPGKRPVNEIKLLLPNHLFKKQRRLK